MAARDYVKLAVSCKPCGVDGIVYYSDTDHPFAASSPRIERVEGPFSAVAEEMRVNISCVACGNTPSNRILDTGIQIISELSALNR